MRGAVALGDVVRPVTTWTPERESPTQPFTYIDLSSIDANSKEIVGARQVLRAEAPSRARQLVFAEDILVSTVRPNLNGVARVPKELDGATASTGFCVLRPDSSRLDSGYLFHWVRSPQFIGEMARLATGASYPAVTDRIVLESKLPLPSVAEQRRIADILDKADTLRAKRRAALAKLEPLAEATFIELFGHPIVNNKRWPLKCLKELADVTTGRTPPSGTAGLFGGPIPFITPGDLENSEAPKRTVTPQGANHSKVVREGASLVCCIGATIGKMSKAGERSAFNQQINAVEWGDFVDDDYGISVLRFYKLRIASLGASTTLPILKKSSFEGIAIPVPPIALQRQFAGRLSVIERVGVQDRNSLSGIEALFACLQHRAFRGELSKNV